MKLYCVTENMVTQTLRQSYLVVIQTQPPGTENWRKRIPEGEVPLLNQRVSCCWCKRAAIAAAWRIASHEWGKKQNKAVVKDIGQIGGKYIKAKGPSDGWRQRRLDDRIYIIYLQRNYFLPFPFSEMGYPTCP